MPASVVRCFSVAGAGWLRGGMQSGIPFLKKIKKIPGPRTWKIRILTVAPILGFRMFRFIPLVHIMPQLVKRLYVIKLESRFMQIYEEPFNENVEKIYP